MVPFFFYVYFPMKVANAHSIAGETLCPLPLNDSLEPEEQFALF